MGIFEGVFVIGVQLKWHNFGQRESFLRLVGYTVYDIFTVHSTSFARRQHAPFESVLHWIPRHTATSLVLYIKLFISTFACRKSAHDSS